MFETYRMLGHDHEVELERLARTGRRPAKPRAPLRSERRARRLPLAVRFRRDQAQGARGLIDVAAFGPRVAGRLAERHR